MDRHTSATVLDILAKARVLTPEQVEGIILNEDAYRGIILKERGETFRRSRSVQPDVSIIDIIEHLKLKKNGESAEPVTDEDVMRAIAVHLGLPFKKIDPLKIDSDVVTRYISKPYALKHQVVPIAVEGETLTVATSNPFAREGVEGIKQSTRMGVSLVVATRADIYKLISEFFGFKYSVAAAHQGISSQMDLGNLEQYVKLKSISELDAADQPIINAVEYLLHYAYDQRASDIHIEPKREHSLVRFRIDGILHTIHKVPKSVHSPMVSRIKGLARMDIAEKRRPQDGRIKTAQGDKEIELRVSTIPVAFGEKVVMRIFDPSILLQQIETLGMLKRERDLFSSFVSAPWGMILVTGPTGSGKTTTLYSALKTIAIPDVNVTTIEDPIEMIYEEFNQTAVHPQIGITFASSLRTLLRQDPDIIMVGEIRDYDTADGAIQAALTGHLVLSTLHTNDAPSSFIRLLDLGIQPFLIKSTLIGIVAQRLLRKVCTYCATPYHLSEEECGVMGIDFGRAKDTPVSIGAGCSHCRGTGYLGRTGVFEVVEVTDPIREAITEKVSPLEIEHIARTEGYVTLRECAIDKLLSGATTFDEIVRVLGVS